MDITHLDHLVLTVANVDLTCAFYNEVLSMHIQQFGDDRKALKFGHQKINLHQKGNEFEPKAHLPTPGSADLCFITTTPLNIVIRELQDKNIPIPEGPVERTGAEGRILSVYFRDPDDNLIEVSNYI